MCEGARAGSMRPSGYGMATVGREVILDRWSQVSQEETFEQRPAWNEGRSPTAHESSASQAERAACKGPAAAASLVRGRAGPGEQAGKGERQGTWPGGAGEAGGPQGCSKTVLKTQRGGSQQGSVRAPHISGPGSGLPGSPAP